MARKKAKPTEEAGSYPNEEAPSKPLKTSNEGLTKRPSTEEIQAILADVVKYLGDLGDTASVVAKTLVVKDMVGERNSDNQCPVANYIKKMVKLPQCSYLSVQHSNILVLEHLDGPELCSVPLPKGVSKFIEAWDSGKYVKLTDVKE